MRIPPRTSIALALLVLGTAGAAWAAAEMWEPAAAGFVVGVVSLVVGVLVGVSE